MAKGKVKKVVLSYSGGLDTSVIVPWLKNNYGGCEVICFTADLGQNEDLSGLEKKAIASGASKLYRPGPARGVPHRLRLSHHAGGRGVRARLPAGHLDRPPADRQEAGRGGGSRGRRRRLPRLHGQGQRPGAFRADASWRSIRSSRSSRPGASGISAAARTRSHYAKEHNVPITQTEKDIYSRDRNLLHLTHEGGLLEDPWNEPRGATCSS